MFWLWFWFVVHSLGFLLLITGTLGGGIGGIVTVVDLNNGAIPDTNDVKVVDKDTTTITTVDSGGYELILGKKHNLTSIGSTLINITDTQQQLYYNLTTNRLYTTDTLIPDQDNVALDRTTTTLRLGDKGGYTLIMGTARHLTSTGKNDIKLDKEWSSLYYNLKNNRLYGSNPAVLAGAGIFLLCLLIVGTLVPLAGLVSTYDKFRKALKNHQKTESSTTARTPDR